VLKGVTAFGARAMNRRAFRIGGDSRLK